MKIKIAKIVCLVMCIGLFVFLLLPFLEIVPPGQPSQLKAQPQVVTHNPLTAIAQRLRTLFGGKERTAQHLAGAEPLSAPTPHPNAELLAAAIPVNQQPPHSPNSRPAQTEQTHPIDIPQAEEPFDFADAALQTDQGDWVLIRQIAPQNGQSGMHEVNVHDNPYDRYIKQERVKRALSEPPKTEIPDSKWARLVRPVKHFFGLDTPTPVGPSPVSVSRQNLSAAHAMSPGNKSQQTEPKSPSMGPVRLPWPDITPQQWAAMTPPQREQERERSAIEEFTNFLSGEGSSKDAAEIMADVKYPNPKDKEEEQAKHEYTQQQAKRNKEIIKNGLLQIMQQNAQGKEPVDELSYMLGCKNTSLPYMEEGCDPSPDGTQALPPATAKNIIESEQAKNAEAFLQATHQAFPKGLPITLVLGPTTRETITNMSGPTQDVQQTAEIYQFLYEYNKCDSETCYWVANAKQIDPQLSDAASMANVTLKGDPLNQYAPLKEAFEQYKVSKLEENATKEQIERARQEANKQFEENPPNYLPYGTRLLQDAQQQKKTFLYFDDPAIHPEVAKAIGTVFIRGVAPLTEAHSVVETGQLFGKSFIQNVQDIKDIKSGSVTGPAVSEAVSAGIAQYTTSKKQAKQAQNGILNVSTTSKTKK